MFFGVGCLRSGLSWPWAIFSFCLLVFLIPGRYLFQKKTSHQKVIFLVLERPPPPPPPPKKRKVPRSTGCWLSTQWTQLALFVSFIVSYRLSMCLVSVIAVMLVLRVLWRIIGGCRCYVDLMLCFMCASHTCYRCCWYVYTYLRHLVCLCCVVCAMLDMLHVEFILLTMVLDLKYCELLQMCVYTFAWFVFGS